MTTEQTDKANLAAAGKTAAKPASADPQAQANRLSQAQAQGTVTKDVSLKDAEQRNALDPDGELARQSEQRDRDFRERARRTPPETGDNPNPASLAAISAAPIPGNMESVTKQHEEVDRRKEALNEHNRAGHDRNMDAIERTSAEAQGKSKHPDYHVPTGKEENRNTPVVHADGSKTWY